MVGPTAEPFNSVTLQFNPGTWPHAYKHHYFSHRQQVNVAADCIFAAGIEPPVAVVMKHELFDIN